MRNATVSRRYAKALFILAQETNSLEDVIQGLSNVRLAVESTPELRQLFFNPTIKPEDKKKVITAVTSNKVVVKFIEVLAKRKRLDLISTIYTLLLEMSDHVHNIVRPQIKTAVALSDDQKRNVEQLLAKTLGGQVVGQFDVEKELLGGILVKWGDNLLEASLRGRLNQFRQSLLHSMN